MKKLTSYRNELVKSLVWMNWSKRITPKRMNEIDNAVNSVLVRDEPICGHYKKKVRRNKFVEHVKRTRQHRHL